MMTTRSTRRLLAAFVAMAALFIATAAFAYGTGHSRVTHVSDPRPPVHVCSAGSIEISPGMAEHDLSTRVYGEIACTSITGHACSGYVSTQPICLSVRRSTNVEIEVTWSNTDTVLALTGPAGSFADDDGGHGTNSRLERALVPGDYLLYLGTYHGKASGDLALSISDASRSPRDERDRGRGHDRDREDRRHGHGRSVRHDRRPDPAALCPAGSQVVELSRWQWASTLSGTASGEVDSSDRVGRFSAGWLPYSPQACVIIEEAGNYSFEITSSPGDTVMAVAPMSGNGTVWFDDDGGSGLMSRTQAFLDDGVYLVYVGTFGWGDRTPFQLVASRI